VRFDSSGHFAENKADLDTSAQNCNSLGRHLFIEMYECHTDQLNDLGWVKNVAVEAANRAQATIVDTIFHKAKPSGVSGVIVIAESHIAIRTWPKYRYAAVDVFTCGKTLKGLEAASYIIEQCRSARPSVMEVERGVLSRGTMRMSRRTRLRPKMQIRSAESL
jgi:S-adenosylmethionine decarboxylase